MNIENLSTLRINKLTQAQYNRELEAGNLDESALYLTPDEAVKQSNWEQDDETAQDYIRNKPFATPTTSDNGKFLRVVNGAAAWTTVPSVEGVGF